MPVNAARLRPLAHTNVLPHHDIWFTKLTTSMAATDRPTDRPTHTASRARRLCLRASRCALPPPAPFSTAPLAVRFSPARFAPVRLPASVCAYIHTYLSVLTSLRHRRRPLRRRRRVRSFACVASGHATTASPITCGARPERRQSRAHVLAPCHGGF